MKYENKKKNICIIAEEIDIRDSVHFGDNIKIKIKGKFSIGNYSRLGNNVEIYGNNVSFGEHLFHTSGLRIGGGGRQHPNANFSIGNRCTIHNNFINVCEPVKIGNDVGLSHDVALITHGYWLSVLDGYPATFRGIEIGNGVIIGYRSLIMMGVNITDECVIGAQSVVTRSLIQKGIYAGSPVKFIREIVPLPEEKRESKLYEIIKNYIPIANFHNIIPQIKIEYPFVYFNDFRINVVTFEYEGEENEETDDFRDYIRKWGIRIYTKRPFVSKFSYDDK